MAITNEQLVQSFLTPQMKCYFEKKLPDVAADQVEVRIEEALKFLNMAAHCSGSIPVTQEIDDVWHYWILETREYDKLCASLHGRRFIHHRSNTYAECTGEDVGTLQNGLAEDVAVLGNYVLNYGPFADDRVQYWLLASFLVNNCGMSVAQLNDWLMGALDTVDKNSAADGDE